MHPRDELVSLVRDGETVARAAQRLGVPRPTVYSWKSRDRAFSDALTEAVRAKRVVRLTPVDPDAPLPDRAELLRRLERHCADGSVSAMLALSQVLPAKPVERDTRTARRLLSLVP